MFYPAFSLKRGVALGACALLFVALSINTVRGQATPEAPLTPYQRWSATALENLDQYEMGPELLAGAGENNDAALAASDYSAVPHHHRLVYQTYAEGHWDVSYVRPGGEQAVRLARTARNEIHPRFNYGARRIVFSSNRNDYEIYAVNPDDTNLAQLTDNASDDVNPAWSPDGRQIVFESYRDGQPEIYVMDADGSNARRLTHHASYDGTPVWSPDGQKIAFASHRDGYYQVYIMAGDGHGLQRLITGMHTLYPAWSPDGESLAFSADGDGNGWLELWTMKADGSDMRKLHDPGAQRDIWVRSWIQGDPVYSYILGTAVEFVLYNGNWYWLRAELRRWSVTGQSDEIGYFIGGESWNPDSVSIDTVAPTMPSFDVPAFARLQIYQPYAHPIDVGGAGLFGVEEQRKEYPGGQWAALGDMSFHDALSDRPPGGKTYIYRLRAWDYAANVSDWFYTTPVTFYAWSLTSNVSDNRGNMLRDATILTDPPSFLSLFRNGAHTNYVPDEGFDGYASWSLSGYRDVPRTYFYRYTEDSSISVVLPPGNELLANGDFESGNLNGWQSNDSEWVGVGSGVSHTGSYALGFLQDPNVEIELRQTVTLPVDMPNPTLSFFYKMYTWPESDMPGLEVEIRDGQQAEVVYTASTMTTESRHAWADLSPWTGKTVTVVFRRPITTASDIRVSLDDISLGSTSPDLWLGSGGAVAALPGETLSRSLTYHNRAGVGAPNTTITLTLPVELTLVNADPAPQLTNPYSWDVGNLAAGESGTIELALTMNTSNTAGQTITAGARITTAYEAYLPNNQIDLAFFVGKKALLPLFTH